MADNRDACDPATLGSEPTWWERSSRVIDHWTPHLLLASSVAMSVAEPSRSPGTRLVTLVVAALAAAWIVVGHNRAPAERLAQPWYAAGYFAGLLALAAVLMTRDTVFFVFAISGFLHASVLRPRPLVFLGTGATSFLILFVTWGGVPTGAEELGAFLSILLVQTLLIGFGVLGGEKLTELNEQRRHSVQELQATLVENEGLHAQLVHQAREAGVIDERQRMAREIHDTIAQGLTGVITQLEAAGQVAPGSVEARRHLDAAARLARDSLAEARRSVGALMPEALAQRRLPDALASVAQDWSTINGVQAEVVTTGQVQPLHPEVEVAMFRVAQEALANVGRHAGASRVGVTLSFMGDVVTLDVRDDGVGFDPATRNGSTTTGGGFGLVGMRDRVERLGGTLAVESGPGEGTAVSAIVPVATTAGQP